MDNLSRRGLLGGAGAVFAAGALGVPKASARPVRTLDLPTTKRFAMGIMKNVTKSGISAGTDPMGLAASVLYLACLNTGESKTQTDIAEAAGVTEVTVRNRYKNLKSHLDLS